MFTETETILVVDDHPVVLSGIALMIKDIRPNATITTAVNATEALQQVKVNNDLDWIFIDVNLPDMSGLDLLRRLRSNRVLSNIIILSSELTPDVLEQALSEKINGVLSKESDSDAFAECIRSVEKGQVFLTTQHANELKYYRQSMLLEKQHIDEKISSRQLETLLMIAKGFSNREIADNMNITESTVKSHVSSLLILFDADNRTHCVSEAQRLGII